MSIKRKNPHFNYRREQDSVSHCETESCSSYAHLFVDRKKYRKKRKRNKATDGLFICKFLLKHNIGTEFTISKLSFDTNISRFKVRYYFEQLEKIGALQRFVSQDEHPIADYTFFVFRLLNHKTIHEYINQTLAKRNHVSIPTHKEKGKTKQSKNKERKNTGRLVCRGMYEEEIRASFRMRSIKED